MALVLTSALLAIVAFRPLGTQSAAFAWLGQSPDVEKQDQAGPTAEVDVRQVTVESGDTLSEILVEQGAGADVAQAVATALAAVYDPSEMRGGLALRLTFSPRAIKESQGQSALNGLMEIQFKPSVERDVRVVRQQNGSFHADQVVKQLKATGVRARGTIAGSLYQTTKDAGIPDAVIVELIRTYSQSVDFQREIRQGDQFDILYTNYVDERGEVIKGGAIDYATLTLSGKPKTLYRFTSSEDQSTDYFTPEGASGKRLLMRTPIDGARLTSGFGLRMHPVLGYTKMHKGVDFSAPSGTPIMAAGNGIVEKAGWFGSFGRYVRVKHPGAYETAYAHMSRFASGIADGSRVRQGQIIGYVGTSGRSTGPHLHYEVLAGASQINPMDVKLPTGTVLGASDLVAFRDHVARVNGVLEAWGHAPALVAQGEVLRAKLLP